MAEKTKFVHNAEIWGKVLCSMKHHMMALIAQVPQGYISPCLSQNGGDESCRLQDLTELELFFAIVVVFVFCFLMQILCRVTQKAARDQKPAVAPGLCTLAGHGAGLFLQTLLLSCPGPCESGL